MNKVTYIFWNIEENRIRTGWRILSTYGIMIVLILLVQWLLKPIIPDSWVKAQKIDLILFFLAIIATFVIWFTRTRLDKKTFFSLGLSIKSGVFRDILVGYLISGILVIIVVAIEMGFGWVTFEIVELEWSEIAKNILYQFVITGLIVSWWENLFFVSYMFLNLKDGCGFRCSYITTCLLFGLVHSANPNASVASFLGITLIHANEVFGWLRTCRLWLILGMHAGWNFFQGLVGFPVSGQDWNQVIKQTNNTPEWLGGGKFGPEAGLLIVLTSLIGFILIYLYSKLIYREQFYMKGINEI